MNKEYLISAAGGNITAIRTISQPQSADWYANEGHKLIEKYEKEEAEQSGFFITSSGRLEMSGGEFCGNATRAVAILVSDFGQRPNVKHSVSGYDGLVSSNVTSLGDNRYDVTSVFSDMPISSSDVDVSYEGYNGSAHLVDLGGIVHVVIDAQMPSDYKEAHTKIRKDIGLENRPAVGVVWTEQIPDGVKIHPVVWVKDSNTFYYETSCGSGSIAVGKVTGVSDVKQVTNQSINVVFSGKEVTLSSIMEVLKDDYQLRPGT